MPLTPLNNDFLQCPICFNAFSFDRKPITLSCSHTCCSSCLKTLQNCPFDQTSINQDLPENEAILSLLTTNNPNLLGTYLSDVSSSNNEKLTKKFNLTETELKHYRASIDCIQNLAQLIKPQNSSSNLLSRPMQRKLISLLHSQIIEGEGRLKAIKFCRSIGERITSELLLKHQDPYTLSQNLWSSVRSRGCQFLGPALQEEILKLVLSALEDGSHLSRKVLVMFVVQRLSPHFPHQASKTAIGHVIQLLYRASCFVLTKRDGDSSLMQLKEEYSTYEALRREHDTQIVSIALESGLKISPDQWSSFLYGSPSYKSHMQSIIDKLQSPQSFNQSIQELIIALQRTSDPANLIELKEHLERLAKIESTATSEQLSSTNVQTNGTLSEEQIKDSEKDLKESNKETHSNKEKNKDQQQYPTYEELAEVLESCKVISFRLVEFLKQYNTLFSNVFRFSRNTNFNGQGKFKINGGKSFNNGNSLTNGIKSNGLKSPTNEDLNLFNQSSLNTNCKTVQSTSHAALSSTTTVLNPGINKIVNSLVNTNGKLDFNTTNSINSINSLNCLNKLNKLKPSTTVIQSQSNGNLSNGHLNNPINLSSSNKANTTSLFQQGNLYLNNSKVSKTTFEGVNKLNSISSNKINGNSKNIVNGNHLTNGNHLNENLTNGNLISSLSTPISLPTTHSKTAHTKIDYLTNLKIDGKSTHRYPSTITNENQKNNQNIQNNQQTKLSNHCQLTTPIKQELLDSHLNHLNQLFQTKQKNGYKKSNPNSFSFDDADDQFIPFTDSQPKISKFGPISRTINLNTLTITGSTSILKGDNLNLNGSSICKNTNVVLGNLSSLIKPFSKSLFVSNEPYVKK